VSAREFTLAEAYRLQDLLGSERPAAQGDHELDAMVSEARYFLDHPALAESPNSPLLRARIQNRANAAKSEILRRQAAGQTGSDEAWGGRARRTNRKRDR
jgi:hypothetical protein